MIKDITKIKERLEGFIEVDDTHGFVRGDTVSYIKLKGSDESFYPGGEFQGKGDNCMFLVKNGTRWKVPLSEKHPDGSIKYRCRFFVKNCIAPIETDNIRDLNQTIQYQQSVIEKLGETLKQLEFQKHELTSHLSESRELLSQTRDNLRNAVHQLSEKQTLVEQYTDLIQKLSQSHPMLV
jgi:hypothetical protein